MSRSAFESRAAGVAGSDPVGTAETLVETAFPEGAPKGVAAAMLVATPGHGEEIEDAVDAVGQLLAAPVVGASFAGLQWRGEEFTGRPALGLMTLGARDCCPFWLPELRADEASAGHEIRDRLGREPDANDLVVLFPDPYALCPEPLLAGLREALGPARVVGAAAVEGPGEPPLQWGEGTVESGALAGLVVTGASPPRVAVTQACRPVSPLLQVTRSDGLWVLELDGRPALEVFREVARGPLSEDLDRARAHLFAGIPRPANEPTAPPEGYLVRNLAGFSKARRAFAVADGIRTGERLAFVLREPLGARDDLKAMLAGLATADADCALYFNCCARGGALFEAPGLEPAYLQEEFGVKPLLGVLGSYEIGPLCATTELLTHTGVLAVLPG